MALGFDCGTYNLVCCTRNEGKNFTYKREVNAFLEVPLDDRFVFNMMKNAGVPLVERKKVAYALGEAAIKMSYTMSDLELKRPMREGCVNPKEKDAFDIMNIMIHSLLEGAVTHDKEVLYYTVPANALNEETDADYHSKVLESIFKAYESENKQKVTPMPINEGLSLVYAELADNNYTGVGISCGAGMINVCFAMFGAPVFQFALVNSGDHIDKMAAKATGENVTFINQEKMKVNLSEPPESMVHRAIQTQYNLMIEKTVNGIKNGLANSDKKVRSDEAIDIVIAGGTSLPIGFDKLFRNIIDQVELPIKVGKIIRPDDPLYSVARGALIAAENANMI